MPGLRSISRIVAGIIAAAAAVGGGWFLLLGPAGPSGLPDTAPSEPPPTDLRKTFPTPFRNVRPGVRYVGDAACASCHPAVAKTFHEHPMGRSAESVGRATPIERYDAAAQNPFTASGFEFRVERAGDRTAHRMSATAPGGDPLPEYRVTADVAIGSGTRGRTYLSVKDGAVWQSPVSWFTKDSRWDLSPAHELLGGARRSITPGCMFCHTNGVDPVPGSENRYREPLFPVQASIGCERCHGPGELHVADRRTGREPTGVDHSIVNPKHLPSDLGTDVCRQCHLQGIERVVRRDRYLFDYRPGLPWDQYVSTFIFRPEESDHRKSVGQFEQVETSRCYTGSGGKLGCTSCHDPHAKPAPAVSAGFYRNRCLTCHESRGCSAPEPDRQARNDSCIDCHMPTLGSSNIAHAAVTDHRIRRRPGPDARAPGRPADAAQFVLYPPGPHAPSAAERDRDWAIAAGRYVGANPAARSLGVLATEKLNEALARWPGDVDAWAVLASVKGAAGNGAEAVEAARAAVAAATDSELALSRLAFEATQAGDLAVALRAADRLVVMSPSAVNHRLTRANVHLRRWDWASAEVDARAALAIQPLYWKARLYLAVCRHHQGDPAGARAEAAVAAGLIPSESARAAYMQWFREQTW